METQNYDTSALVAAGIPEEEAVERIRQVVERYGPGFAHLAANPRLLFTEEGVVITLWKPIQTGDGKADTLTMGEPTLAQMRKLDGIRGQIAMTQGLIVSTCNLTEREAGQLGLRDVSIIGALNEAFTGAVPSTGVTR